MVHEIVTQLENGGRRLTGTRVSLDSIVHAYWNGQSVHDIVSDFPSLTPQQVSQAIKYYLDHRSEVDMYLEEQEKRWAELSKQQGKSAQLVKHVHQSLDSPSV